MLGACTTSMGAQGPVAEARPQVPPEVSRRYAAITDEPFPVEAVDPHDLKARNVRQVVAYPTREPPGTLVVDPQRRFLYLVMEGGKAMRYGVGVGKAGFEFTGEATVARKASWPRWTPTPDMLRRDPERNGRWAGGMPGGARNPLGARALYLFKDGKDTLYRIHGTTEPWSIGEAVSSGCIRMLNQDVIDLHRRVPTGTRVVVLGSRGTAHAARPAGPETTGSLGRGVPAGLQPDDGLDHAGLDGLSREATEAPIPEGVANDEGL
ncbi:L,D-transpeptidase [Methylobacterium ajmalii]|uniref:L,D-transpeptidase n=1 Tax=Methylobacterium ajmalii TaxID=2738439 RepID=UPI00190C90C5|nr:L,D-transpeptidase [Methylobacterium ajmalii]MBK3398087.1 L,D-transpeptidase [Methylobacterium ajmalii]MBK3406881.1 L,D-transpeptidase [Methylobacterium ajmalii]MBK3420627.1 L,D-transpeptidase [Methylobacterium ajmalii]MBZ6416480.1 L,D-transpeptidase [Methylobacterium sp.]